MAEQAKPHGAWVKLGDIQPSKPAEKSKFFTRKQNRHAEKKKAALREFEGKPCPYCRELMTRNNIWPKRASGTDCTRDHAFPKSQGWRLDDFDGSNRIICCYRCNFDKDCHDICDWYVLLHAGRDPRAQFVRAVILAFCDVQAKLPTWPVVIRQKLNLARLRLSLTPRELAREAVAVNAARTANQS